MKWAAASTQSYPATLADALAGLLAGLSASARSSTDRASDYGSEGLGFESLRAHFVMSRDMLIACLESCLYFFGFEFVAFGHSSLSGCSFFWSWFDASWLIVGVGVDGEFAEYFSGFSVDDGDV